MNAGSSGKNTITFLSRLAIAGAFTVAVLSFAAAPDLRGETPPDQIKAAGAIPLTTELLDKMDKFITNVSADEAAKAELAAVGKDPSITPETWGSVVSTKCPKAAAIFKASGLTADEFGKGIFTLMAVGMSDDLAKSEDKTVQANAAFFAANKDRAGVTFANFMMLGEPGPGASPATSP
ncbi:MAG TPA: hypothetical protein VLO30_01725 [Chthoniobacterales bacterium]|nr:hypothetical protein [Chthoniobacterales bacterium]